MASVTVKTGTQLRFIAASGFSPADPATDWTVGTPTDVLLTMSAVADAAGRQSSKADLTDNRAPTYKVSIATDHTGETVAGGGTTDIYWLPSSHATAANGNVAGNSGVDADAPGGALGGITLAELIDLGAVPVGSMVHHDGAVVQNAVINSAFDPGSRYGQMLWVNNSGVVYEADNVEMHLTMDPNVGDVT